MRLARLSLLLGPALLTTAMPAQSPSLAPDLLDLYKNLHAHPELSHLEEHTSAHPRRRTARSRLHRHRPRRQIPRRLAGLRRRRHPQERPRPHAARARRHGRAPHRRRDRRSLRLARPRAQQARARRSASCTPADMTSTPPCSSAPRAPWLAAKDKWHGTLMLIGQPSEETIDGAKAMLADHLYERFGKPDLRHRPARHQRAARRPGRRPPRPRHGQLHLHRCRHPRHRRPRLRSAVRPRSHHPRRALHHADPDHRQPRRGPPGPNRRHRRRHPRRHQAQHHPRRSQARAHHALLHRRRAVKRVIDGLTRDGRRHHHLRRPSARKGGDRHGARERVHSSPVQRSGSHRPRARCPRARLSARSNVIAMHPVMGSEDVGIFGLDGKIPVGYFRLGAMYPDRFAAAKAQGKLLPGPHTSKFEPDPEPTLRTGITAMTAVATALLQ